MSVAQIEVLVIRSTCFAFARNRFRNIFQADVFVAVNSERSHDAEIVAHDVNADNMPFNRKPNKISRELACL